MCCSNLRHRRKLAAVTARQQVRTAGVVTLYRQVAERFSFFGTDETRRTHAAPPFVYFAPVHTQLRVRLQVCTQRDTSSSSGWRIGGVPRRSELELRHVAVDACAG